MSHLRIAGQRCRTYTYDAAGNLQTVRDENQATPNTTYGYDFANRLTTVTQTLPDAPGRSREPDPQQQ